MRCNSSLLYKILFGILLGAIWAGCEGPQGPSGRDATVPDTQAPLVDWVYPFGGDVLDSVVVLEVNATDNTSVDSVSFIVNGHNQLNGLVNITGANGHFRALWDTRLTDPGSYSLVARAYDHAGNVGLSAPVNVLVYNVLAGQNNLQNFANFPDIYGWNLPDSDGTAIYAVELTPVQACSLIAIRYDWLTTRTGQSYTDTLKYYLFAPDSVTGYPGATLDSLVILPDSLPNRIQQINVPGRIWPAHTSMFIGIGTTRQIMSNKIQIATDIYPYVGRDWYFIPNSGWFRIPSSPDPHNLIIGAVVNYTVR